MLRRIVGRSMLPALRPNRIVLARRSNNVSPGDVVLLHHNGLEKIKRVKHIQDDKIFVLGDNPTESTDSRTFGHIARKNILAKVIWPAT